MRVLIALLAGLLLTVAPVSSRAAEPAPEPDAMTLTWLYWGNVMEEWTFSRDGQGRWRDRDGQAKTFVIKAEDYDRIRAIFQPYEGRDFHCDRTVYDLPYGRLKWSREGQPDETLNWDRGCVARDAIEVMNRVDEAETILTRLRDGG